MSNVMFGWTLVLWIIAFCLNKGWLDWFVKWVQVFHFCVGEMRGVPGHKGWLFIFAFVVSVGCCCKLNRKYMDEILTELVRVARQDLEVST